MNNSANTEKRSRRYGILIIAVIALPMTIAYVMFHTGWGIPGGTSNKGQLLTPPQPIQDLALNTEAQVLSDLYLADKAKRWRIVVPVTGNCNAVCEANLYLTRQVHIRLAEKAYRVERIFLLLDEFSESKRESLLKDHPNTVMVNTTRENLQQWLQAVSLPKQPEDLFYLVDQNGFTMMLYSQEHTGQDLLDDLKKVLKFTYDK